MPQTTMTYPNNFEEKIGFAEIRSLLRQHCLGVLGKEEVDAMTFATDAPTINEWQQQTRELRRLTTEEGGLPMQYFFDVRKAVARLRLEGTHMEEDELFDLRRSLETITAIVDILNTGYDDSDVTAETEDKATTEQKASNAKYPHLCRLTEGVDTFPQLTQRIDQILDKYGHIKDTASTELSRIRSELAHTEGSISRTLNAILRSAQSDGLVEKDVAPTMRDGRLVIPVAPSLKRKIRGIVHDESASGKTVFIEPAEVVEANNHIRELEAEERREVIRILTDFAKQVRPHVPQLLASYHFLAVIDFIHAKAELAEALQAYEPTILDYPHIDWISARHPLLLLSLNKQGKKTVPLDIMLTAEKRILIISGPNAGGKSVCLKTVGLLQYMVQCGLPIPIGERSKMGVFNNIMIDIGDEQSIEDDLSTYSSHLANMKKMIKQADSHTLLLIDEFGSGTEPQIGGAIAEAVLKQFCHHETYGVITTHYQNLKHFADNNESVVNGAMLYDRHEMRPLFQLSIGRPGSSFAIEIARKTGLPEEVINDAAQIVGSDYIQSDKYLQDIVRDKRYWEGKRQTIHQHEKTLEQRIAHYEEEINSLEQSRKDILRHAKEQAEEILSESNKRIENAIRTIRETQAEKEATKQAREELEEFKADIKEIDAKANDELIAKKIRQLQERKERKEKRKREKSASKELRGKSESQQADQKKKAQSTTFEIGDTVRIKGLSTVGTVESTDGKTATIIFGDMRTKMRTERLEHAAKPKPQESRTFVDTMGRNTRATIDDRKKNFHQDIDVRGMRGDEALNAVTNFIDDAILVGMPRVRILHGTGTGILRQLIRQYLATVPAVASFHDEHVQFGGAGITVVDLE